VASAADTASERRRKRSAGAAAQRAAISCAFETRERSTARRGKELVARSAGIVCFIVILVPPRSFGSNRTPCLFYAHQYLLLDYSASNKAAVYNYMGEIPSKTLIYYSCVVIFDLISYHFITAR